MAMVHFSVRGVPVAKERPRTRIVQGRGRAFAKIYTPAKTKNYERLVRYEARLAMRAAGLRQFLGPVIVNLSFDFPIPPSYPAKLRAECLAGTAFHTKRPDIENLEKIILDAMNDCVFHDDAQVVESHCRKRFAADPKVSVHVEELPTVAGPLFAEAVA